MNLPALLAYLDPGSGDSGIQAGTIIVAVVVLAVVVALVVLAFRFFIRSERAAKKP